VDLRQLREVVGMSAAETEPAEAVHPTDLSTYQHEALFAIGAGGAQKGLEVLEKLRDRYDDPNQSHGRIYPNLDTLVELGLVEKVEHDGRENRYSLTPIGKRFIRQDAQRRHGIAETLNVRGEE
jgi:DNA-binding PadR family transcriptional regulator